MDNDIYLSSILRRGCGMISACFYKKSPGLGDMDIYDQYIEEIKIIFTNMSNSYIHVQLSVVQYYREETP